MRQRRVSAAWASTALDGVLQGRDREATVWASSELASYLELPGDGGSPAVVALLSKKAVRLPIGVVLETDRLPERGSCVTIGNGLIASRDGAWRPVRWWDPRPVVSVESLFEHWHPLTELLEDQAPASFGLPLAESFAIASDLARGEPAMAVASIGLGPGLTPAADDVVAGAFAVLALGGFLDDDVRSEVVACARTRTTALSAALIGAAGRAEMIPQAASVLSALAEAAPTARLRAAVAGLFAVGATSGHDLCAGIAGALAAGARAGAQSSTARRPR
jgi:hypothetical protein